jgi:hypothetical protein
MSTSATRLQTSGRGGAIERREYLIDHFRVSFQNGAAWNCLCREFATANSCRHTREAAGMRDAQAKITASVSGGGSNLRLHTLRQATQRMIRA